MPAAFHQQGSHLGRHRLAECSVARHIRKEHHRVPFLDQGQEGLSEGAAEQKARINRLGGDLLFERRLGVLVQELDNGARLSLR